MYIDNEWATIIDNVDVAASSPFTPPAMALQILQFEFQFRFSIRLYRQRTLVRLAVAFAVAYVVVAATQSPIHPSADPPVSKSYKSKHSGLIKHTANSYPDWQW